MNHQVFKYTLDPYCVNLLHDFLYTEKDHAFFQRWMKRIPGKTSLQDVPMWECLIRDTQNFILTFPNHQLSGYNFSQFIESFVNSCSAKTQQKAIKCFQKFCIQSFKNNSQLIMNRYYVGNGGSPTYQLISTYLVSQTINSSLQHDQHSPILLNSMNNIFCFIYENYILQQKPQQYHQLRYSLLISNISTIKTVQTIDKIMQFLKFKYRQFYVQPYNKEENQASDEFIYLQEYSLKRFFKDLMQKYTFNCQSIQRFSYLPAHYEQKHFPFLKKNIWNIIQILNYKHPQILKTHSKLIAESILKYASYELFKHLFALQNFQNLMFSQQFVFQIIKKRHFQWMQIIWSSSEQKRLKLSKMTKDQLNILQFIAQSRGLSHNFITLFWESGLFNKMPHIKNTKSKQIIQQMYPHTLEKDFQNVKLQEQKLMKQL